MSIFDEAVNDLCSKLLQNEPTLVEFSTHQAAFFVTTREKLDSNFQQLGLALKNNTVVTSVQLRLDEMLHTPESAASAIGRVQDILHFLEHSRSLQKVGLHDMDQYYPHSPRVPLLSAILDAIVKNPSIRSLESTIYYIPLDLVTKLLTANQTLQQLNVNIHHDETIQGDVDAAAKALGSHPALENISLSTNKEYIPLAPFLQVLTRLELAWNYIEFVFDDDMQLLPSVLESARKLEEVSLAFCVLDGARWVSIWTALQANPSITSLRLSASNLSAEATAWLLRDLQSSDATQQHIRKLHLSGCDLTMPFRSRSAAVADIARMLCGGSLLTHVILTSRTLKNDNLREFFEVLSSSSPSVVSLELLGVNHRALRHVGAFLPTTVHLRRLKVHVDDSGHPFEDLTIPVPPSLLSGLCHNGSLHLLEIRTGEYASAMTPSARVVRIIDAYTTRNRDLPKLLKTSFASETSNPTPSNDNAQKLNGSRLPALCQSASQAPKMAPNSTLIGLLASLQSLGHTGQKVKRTMSS